VSRNMPPIVAAIAACLASAGLLGLGGPAPACLAAMLAMFGVAPGAALLPLLAGGRTLPPGLVVGTSLGIDAVLAQLMLATGTFHPAIATYLLAGCCLPALGLNLVRAMRPTEAPVAPAPPTPVVRVGGPAWDGHDGQAGSDDLAAADVAAGRPMTP
jgi:hypothetical protein